MKNILIDVEEFKKEEKHLDALVKAIMLVLNNPQDYLPFSGVSEYDTSSDYDENDELLYKKKSNRNYYEKNIEPWVDRIDQPYYGRLDVNVDGEFKSIYIGEDDLYQDDKRVIYSGQSPIGMFFTQTSLKNGGFGKAKYEALLRRKLLIENKELVLAEDVFIAGVNPKFRGITDPYLLRVLQSNRTKSSMTSILSSIQEKQFEIVCLPRSSSFIVQGCAGSGKTAILFQRLSNIQYNNPGYIDNRVRIISPNPGFIEFVGPLAKQLKLTHLTPITMCDYYNELLKRYDLEPLNNIEDENLLNKNLIEEFYSDNFLFRIANDGKKYIDEQIKGIDLFNLSALL